ncbi:MAG: 50S ribosomal protein L17 [Nitrospirota bacterium]
MRHKVAGKGFGRNTNHRKALLRNLVTSLFEHLKIETTTVKAKEARRMAERVITLCKKGDLHSRRLALAYVPNKTVITRLFTEIAPKIQRNSGYLRVLKSRFRQGDNSDMAILEFVDYDLIKGESGAEKDKKKAKEEKKDK